MVRLFNRRRLLSAFAAVLITRFVIRSRLGRTVSNTSSEQYLFGNLRQQKGYSPKQILEDTWALEDIPAGGHYGEEEVSVKQTAKECFESFVDWSEVVEPKYKMNPDKFLIPTLTNGPNNQMMGFQQSILLSLLLNRTLVLPTFFEHRLQNVHFRRRVSPEYRIDISKLRKFITVIPNSKAVKMCNSKLNAIFSSKGKSYVVTSLNKLVRIYMETTLSGVEFVDGVGDREIDILKRYLYANEPITDTRLLSQPWCPKNQEDIHWTSKIMKSSDPIIPIFPSSEEDVAVKVEDIKAVYNTEAKCALYWQPFRQFQFGPEFKGAPHEVGKFDLQELNNADGWNLYSDILRHSVTPKSIGVWADDFRREIIEKNGQDYIAVHWRFDEKDFFSFLCKEKPGRSDFCANARRATNATAIAAGILRRMNEVESQFHTTIKTVYFAAPPTLKALVDDVKRALVDPQSSSRIRRSLGIQGIITQPMFFSINDLEEFILRKYSACTMASSSQLSDTMSQVEMNICEHSFSFMWSRQSTWSINVRLHRYLTLGLRHRRYDVSSLDYALKSIDGGVK